LTVATDSYLPSAADFNRLEGGLFSRITVRHKRQVLRHRLVAAAALLVVAGAGVAAGTIASPSQQSRFAYCYSGSTTSARVAQLLLPTGTKAEVKSGAAATASRASNALVMCRTAWQGGAFNTSSSTDPFPVPKLQVCLRDDLIISVFRKPNGSQTADAFCNHLGLSAP
jgi:hypothetical protein